MQKETGDSLDSIKYDVFSELQRPSLRGAVIERFHLAIINGTLKSGQRITENQICRLTGVSRTTVREAFQELRSLGILREDRRKTFIIDEPDKEEIRDIYAFRGLCEGFAAEQAKANLKDEEIKMLRKCILEMEWASRKRDIMAFREADLAFHELIWRANGKKHLMRLLKSVTFPYHPFFVALLRRATRKELLAMTQLHQNQLESLCRSGDNKIREWTELHYRSVAEQFLHLYGKCAVG